MSKPFAMHLKIAIKNCEYVLGTLSFNLDKAELSYHISFPSGTPNKQLDIDSDIETDRIDHITWHEKVVHLKAGAKKIGQIPMPGGKFIPTEEIVKPILVEGFFLKDADCPLIQLNSSFSDWKSSEECLITSFEEKIDFSLVLMLVPESCPTKHIFLTSKISAKNNIEHDLFYIRGPGHDLSRMKGVAKGWDLIVFTTPFVREIDSKSLHKIKGPIRFFDYTKPENSLYSILNRAYANPKLSEEDIEAFSAFQNSIEN